MNNRLRKKLAWLHTWTGLITSLALIMFAVTGIGIVFPQLNSTVNQDLLSVPHCSEPISLDQLIAKASALHPASVLSNIDLRSEKSASVAIQFADKDFVYMDPCTSEVLGIQNEYGGFIGTLNLLHRFRFMDHDTGKLIGGWITAFFGVMLLIGGVFLWWPNSTISLKKAATFNPKLSGIARTLNLHKVTGIYAGLILLLITVTALPIAFHPIKDWVYRTAGYTKFVPPKSTFGGADVPGINLNRVSKTVSEHFPSWEWISINVQKKPHDAIKVEIIDEDSPHEIAKSYLYLDAYTGGVLAQLRYAQDTPLGRKIYLYCIALHSGLIGGLLYQSLLFIATLSIPVLVYTGISSYFRRKFRKPKKNTLTLKVVGKIWLSSDVCVFEFAHSNGAHLPPFTAGSHIDVYLNGGIVRQYSLCNNPADTDRYVIGVLRAELSRGGSRCLHETIEVGDFIEVGTPKNYFPLTHSSGHALLIAGGIGITPLLSMAEHLTSINADFHLYYCVSKLEHAAFMEPIKDSHFAKNVTLHVSETDGRLDISSVLDNCALDTHLYVCGPNTMMDAILDSARDKGWSDDQLHQEYFAGAEHSNEHNTAFAVKVASLNKVIDIPENRPITDVLAEHGIAIPVSCAEGICGTCLTRVIEGEVEHRDVFLSQKEHDIDKQFTPCCSRARSSILVLDL